jgi:hypothetical protein
MASIQSVRGEAAWQLIRRLTRFPLPAGFGGAVFDSQSRNWLTERFANSPQVCRFLDEKPPLFDTANRNFKQAEDLTAQRY